MGGFSSPPNRVGVAAWAISRSGTRRSGRLPVTWILREPAIGVVTASDSSRAARARSEGMAFIGFSFLADKGEADGAATEARVRGRTLPVDEASYAGTDRIRFEGTLSARAIAWAPPLREGFKHEAGQEASVRRSRGAGSTRA